MKRNEQEALIWNKINSETAKIQWLHLQRFFAAGHLIVVDKQLDLVEIAFYCHQDEAKQIDHYRQKGLFLPVSDEQAKIWHKNNSFLWTIVVKPLILVQPIE